MGGRNSIVVLSKEEYAIKVLLNNKGYYPLMLDPQARCALWGQLKMVIDTKAKDPKDSTCGIKEHQLVTFLKAVTFEISEEITHKVGFLACQEE